MGQTEYVFLTASGVARRDFDPSTGAATGVFYYFSDHLKTASVITDSAGNTKAESDYYPWGGELQFVNNDSNHYKFTGKERDESGLDYFGARYYSNGLGRFITPDWSADPVPVPYADLSDPQSLNQYSYVRNIPTVKVDADGHDGCCDTDLEVDMEMVKQTLRQLGPAAGPAIASAGSIGLSAAVIGGPFVLTYALVKAAGPVTTDDQMAMGEGQVSEPEDGQLHLATQTPQTPNTQPKPPTPPAPQLGYKKDEDDKEHTTGKRKSTKDKHEKVDPGKKQPPNYRPDRKYVQPKDDKKKDKPKPPYHRKDRDKKQEGS